MVRSSLKYALASAVLGLSAAALYSPAPVEAQKPFLLKLRKTQGLESTKNGKCALCHIPNKDEAKDSLNVYGKALQAVPGMKPIINQKEGDDHKFTDAEIDIMLKAVDTINEEDSDGDGATNGEEFALGTFPGDPASTPDAAAVAAYRKTHPLKGPPPKAQVKPKPEPPKVKPAIP